MPPSLRDGVPRGQRGSALVLVAVLGFLTMALWATAYRATHDSIRAEAFAVRRQQVGQEAAEALARALELLRTGEPPGDAPQYIVELTTDGETRAYLVSYELSRGRTQYQVESRPATERERSGLPALPVRFERDEREDDMPRGLLEVLQRAQR